MSKRLSKGFTLIELLVVIAIIGILSSVVLASLNTARGKGADAAIKSNINNMRAQAELRYDTDGGTYANVCTDANVTKALASLLSASGVTGGTDIVLTDAGVAGNAGKVTCHSTLAGWAIESPLKSNTAQVFCADNSGLSTSTTVVLTASSVACGS